MRRANVIIAVRDTDLRPSLDLMLRDEPYLYVLGTASTLESTFELTRIERPELILLEWAMTDRPIEEMLKEIKDYSPNSKVILLGNSSNQELLISRCDADAYLVLGCAPEGLRSTIQNLITQDSETTQVKE
jgi:NarL family two-component system response regulator YdfI